MNFGLLAQETGDPIFSAGHIWGWPLVIILGKVVVSLLFCLLGVLLMVWFERKAISKMQNRVGPNRAGPFGLLQTLADGTKLFFKENLFPERADKWVFRLAPYLSAVPAFLTFCIIPIGGDLHFGKYTTHAQLADPPMGVLLALMISGIAVYGVMLAGWSSGSKYPLMGSVRASAQMVSYEAALGLSLAAVILTTGTLSTHSIVEAQSGWRWNVFTTVLVPFVIFCIAATAELNRPPFDLVEAESELVGGFHTEYSSARFAFFFLAEFMNTITMSALIITLFLGGPKIPFNLPFIGDTSPLFFMIKLIILLYTYILLRATLPRFRYDQLMDLGWKKLIPGALLWLLVLASIKLANGDRIQALRNLAIAAVGCGVCIALLGRAMKVGRITSDQERDAVVDAGSNNRLSSGRF
jgi:NADH-quinone oxidoreductase subunit H